MEKLNNFLAKAIPLVFITAACLNLVFNNEWFGYNGNIIQNALTFFMGAPIYVKLCRAIPQKATPPTASKLLITLGIDTIVFLTAGAVSIITGHLEGCILIALIAVMAASSLYFLYLLYKWKYYGQR